MGSAAIGLVGLGLVGQAIGRRLRAAGLSALGFDLRPEAMEAFSNEGGKPVAALRELGRQADCAILAVFNTADVENVLEGANGLLAPGHSIRCVIDCSTGDPERLQALAARLASQGVDFIEAPLSGSSQQIGAGEATMLLGGEVEAIEQSAAVLQAISSQRIHIGAAGMGAKAKLATNLVLGLNRAALAEGMVFAQSLGIEPERFLALVLATPARSGAAETKGAMMASGDFAPQSRIRQHLKDVDLMLETARVAGVPLPLSETHAQLMRAAVAAGDGDLDNAAIIRQLRRAAGLQDQT